MDADRDRERRQAIEAADVVLMDDKPSKIARAMRVARKTMRIVWQNIVFAIGVKCSSSCWRRSASPTCGSPSLATWAWPSSRF